MNRVICTFSLALAAAPILTFGITSAVPAQSVPQVDRLSPLQRQQFARDLVPSNAQDFFNAGNAKREQEIRRLAQPRSPLTENVLRVNQGMPMQPNASVEQPDSLQRDRVK